MAISATSSPMRFEKVQGVCFVTCMNVANAKTGEHICTLVQGEGRTWYEAKTALFNECREYDIFLTPRNDNPHHKAA